MQPTIQMIADADERSAAVERVMRALPEWFYWESTIVGHRQKVRELPVFAAHQGSELLGIIAIIPHTEQYAASEILVMGVMPDRHGHGVGRALIEATADYARGLGKRHLTVKTLADGNPNPHYAATRRVYERCGFAPLMPIVELWDADNPCLLMLKTL